MSNLAPRSSDVAAPAQPMMVFSMPVAQEGENQSLWRVIDDRLRGRWHWMLLCGFMLGLIGLILGWRSTAPEYRSTGAIRIAPRINLVMGEDDGAMSTGNFGTFVGTQVQLIQSRRVIDRALEDSRLATAPWAGTTKAAAILEKHLDVEAERGSQLIFVSFGAESDMLAQSVVGSIVDAYITIWGNADSGDLGKRMTRLSDHEGQLRRDRASIREEKMRIHTRYGTTDVPEYQMRKRSEYEETRTAISVTEDWLARVESGDDDDAALNDLTGQQLEMVDERLRTLGMIRDEAETNFATAQNRYRPGSYGWDAASRAFDEAKSNYQAQVDKLLLNRDHIARKIMEQGMGTTLPLTASEDQMRSKLALAQKKLGTLEVELKEIVKDLGLLSDLELREENVQADLDEVQTRRGRLELEEPMLRAGRISVVQDATLPIEVYADGRKKRAAFGVLSGLLASFGFFFLLGTLDRRTFGSHQVSDDGEVPCLGVLPDLRRKASDRETTDVASHCVHQIRNQIEVKKGDVETYALAVTSPHQGDGKTSVVMALGWSYAAAGYKTLLVDCDLVGRSLTRQLGLVGQNGLKEVVMNGTANGEIVSLPVPQLSALPAGADPHFGPEAVRQRDVTKLLDQLRETYDMIIVDTGPLLGSLESTPVVTATDGVVVLARRGRSRSRLDEVTNRLKNVGANCLGVILNGAVRAECDRYVSEASLAAPDTEKSDDVKTVSSVVRAADGEQNMLMLAMETTTRPRPGESKRSRRDDQTP